jgi:hypothetical protein
MNEWVDEVSDVQERGLPDSTGILWREEQELYCHRLYYRVANEGDALNAVVEGLTVVSLAKTCVLSFTGWEQDIEHATIPVLYVAHMDVLKQSIISLSTEFSVFFITPAYAMNTIDCKLTLAEQLESLQAWLLSDQSPEVTLVMVDYRIENKSDTSAILPIYCHLKLK